MCIAVSDNNLVWKWGHFLKEEEEKKYKLQKMMSQSEHSYKLVAVGGNHAAFVDKQGFLYSWGYNSNEQLGVRRKYKDDDQKMMLDKAPYEARELSELFISSQQTIDSDARYDQLNKKNEK